VEGMEGWGGGESTLARRPRTWPVRLGNAYLRRFFPRGES